ncbi:hypothetical protein E0H93_34730 [Rhizobium leguminosarum bv. viciae]|uniref:Uncharacterized protein n=1 Tax=Rhizobium esperanzae TaxID=1967781 RepID=A0A7W6UH58_9HYPH|nr:MULTISPECIES: hypothetical protein [Rhizobium]MBB4438134.1 hypothetical protein [Rhizobium esperanzae]MBY5530214.1 hypothetical protein [Rhizobium leguminosarum]MDH6200955.1 hypothetical protein [Rhizobium leguminosarum]TBY30685.1 hypothetical protein E0H55_20610 [Rhizobium leguminosarum bv. viciae]TBY35705.1 hypothetical protein E0H60_22775 [Rhizobium leguminosarum bv. viciae]
MRNFEADDETLEELDKLREFYGLQTAGFTIRRALAIASMLKEFSDADGTVTVVKPGTGGQETVKLNQRYKLARN